MTELEQASLDAFNELVSHGGKTLTVGGQSVQALVQFIEPENAQYTLEAGEGQDVIVQALQTSWPAGYDRKGKSFTIPDTFNFRVKSSRKDGLFWFLRCSATEPDA